MRLDEYNVTKLNKYDVLVSVELVGLVWGTEDYCSLLWGFRVMCHTESFIFETKALQ